MLERIHNIRKQEILINELEMQWESLGNTV